MTDLCPKCGKENCTCDPENCKCTPVTENDYHYTSRKKLPVGELEE